MKNRRCFLCGFKRQENDYSIAMHGFPKNTKVRAKWFKFCGFTEGVDKVDNVFICSMHFTSSDFSNARRFRQGKTLSLKVGAVPSKRKPQPLALEPLQQSSNLEEDNMSKSCLLCGFKRNKSDYSVSMHKFPRDPKTRSNWYTFCGLTEGLDKVDNVSICSLHFNSDDFTFRNYQDSQTLALKPGAVPSKKRPQPLVFNEPSTLQAEITCDKQPEQVEVHSDYIVESEENTMILPEDSLELSNPLQETGKVVIYEIRTIEDNNVIIQQPNQAENQHEVINSYIDDEDEEIVELLESSAEQPSSSFSTTGNAEKRKCFEPRYVAEIRTPDVDNPRKAHRVLQLVRETDKKKSHKIRGLQRENNRLRKQIERLKEEISELHSMLK